MRFIWEEINSLENRFGNVYMETFRAKVIGGWIVRQQILLDTEKEEVSEEWANCHNSMVFIPDPNHEWEVD